MRLFFQENNNKQRNHDKLGYTLTEVLTVVCIISLAGIFSLSGLSSLSRLDDCQKAAHQINSLLTLARSTAKLEQTTVAVILNTDQKSDSYLRKANIAIYTDNNNLKLKRRWLTLPEGIVIEIESSPPLRPNAFADSQITKALIYDNGRTVLPIQCFHFDQYGAVLKIDNSGSTQYVNDSSEGSERGCYVTIRSLKKSSSKEAISLYISPLTGKITQLSPS